MILPIYIDRSPRNTCENGSQWHDITVEGVEGGIRLDVLIRAHKIAHNESLGKGELKALKTCFKTILNYFNNIKIL